MAIDSSFTPSERPGLVQIYPAEVSSKHQFKNIVIAIPEFDIPSVLTWREGSDCWLSTRMPSILTDVCILSFEPGFSSKEDFSWRKLLSQGDSLLEQMLVNKICQARDPKRLFFICHGLGGLILKRAMAILFEKSVKPGHQMLMGSIAGTMLLGCPSPAADRPQDLRKLTTFLKAVTRLPSRSIDQAERDVAITASISQKFTDFCYDMPVLSVFETKISRIGKNIFSPRELLVDQYLCETLTKREGTVGVNRTHQELSVLDPSDDFLWKEIAAFIAMAQEIFTSTLTRQSMAIDKKASSTHLEVGKLHVQLPHSSFRPESFLSQAIMPARSWSSDDFGIASASMMGKQGQKAELPCYILPPQGRNAHFVGRRDVLSTLEKALLPTHRDQKASESQSRLRPFALCGVGGVGKSAIATEFCFAHETAFDAIFWVNAGDPATLAADFARIAVSLGLDSLEVSLAQQDVARSIVLAWLSNPDDWAPGSQEPGTVRRQDATISFVNWLLVFDNADSLRDLREYWPASEASGSVLVTSRDPIAKTTAYVHSSQGIDLKPFNVEDASSWLRRLTRYNMTKEDTDLSEDIVKMLGGLPLAIYNVATAILRRDLSFAEFLQLYSQEAFRTELYQSQPGSRKPLWATFALDDLSLGASALLHVLCFLNPDSIPDTLLTNFFKRNDKTTDTNSYLEGFPDSQLTLMKARAELNTTSLITRNPRTQDIAIHRVVQAATIASMELETLSKAFRTTLKVLARAWPDHTFDWNLSRWKLSEPLLPHVLHLASQFEMSQTLQEEMEDQCIEFATLLVAAAWYQSERGLYMEALPVNRLAQKLIEEAPICDYLVLAMSHMNLLEIGLQTGDFAMALSHSKDLIGIAEAHPELQARVHTFGIKYLGYTGLAEALMEYSEWDEAIKTCDLAIEAKKHDNTKNFPTFATIDKSHCLWRKGELDKAWEVLEGYVKVRSEVPSSQEFKIVLSIVEQGNIRAAQGRWDDSLDFHLQAYKRYLDLFGRGHFRIASLAGKLGQHYHRRGELPQAKDFFMQSLAHYSNRSYHASEIIRTTFQLAKVLQELGDTSAEETRKKAELELLDLSLKKGRRLKEEDLEEIVATWAV